MREQTVPSPSHLNYLGSEGEASIPRRNAAEAGRIVLDHAWMIERAMGRIAAHWPGEIQLDPLYEQATMALREVARSAETPGEVAEIAAEAIEQSLTAGLAESDWYRDAVVTRARPLCDAWAGALLAGREPTDHLLCSWLRLSTPSLRDRYLEMAVVFAVQPSALLRNDADIQARLEQSLSNLPGDQQLVTSIYFQDDITFAEIAQVMRISAEQAQCLLGRSAMALVGETALVTWPGRISA